MSCGKTEIKDRGGEEVGGSVFSQLKMGELPDLLTVVPNNSSSKLLSVFPIGLIHSQ